jgi:hypothetical protein
MPFFERIRHGERFVEFPARGEFTRLKKRVSGSPKRRNNHKRPLRDSLSNNAAGAVHRGAVFDRRAAELHNDHSIENTREFDI